MDTRRADTDLQPNSWRSRLVLLPRWLCGGILGCVLGLFLFVLSESGQPPLIGPVIFGQVQLFEELMFYFLEDNFRSSAPVLLASVIAYTLIWVVIGALLFSGKKKQLKAGIILSILYMIVGFLWYVVWAIRIIPALS